ncbi:Solute carrier family 35 member F5 [Nymphon striatum]|nr:Solute carrier family 35 member F5 [Nymphon striatum]
MNKSQRLFLGTTLLLLVDIIWVTSSEIIEHMFPDGGFHKPFFVTYLKTSMFALYMLGFIVCRPWRAQCFNQRHPYAHLINNGCEDDHGSNTLDTNSVMTNSVYVPAKLHEDNEKSSGTESDDSSSKLTRSVRFSKLAEVRQLSDSFANDANLARLSFTASLRVKEAATIAANKLQVKKVAKIAFIFCIFWYIGNFSYNEALSNKNAGIITVLSSSSGFFTLILAAFFPANNGDRITLSKLIAVIFSMGGVVLICWPEMVVKEDIPMGAFWAILGAFFYATYIVYLRKKIDNEGIVDIPMFLGFVGVFNIFLIWPGFALLHFTNRETFEWPTKQQWLYLVINGFISTVISELLWLWGCFLTSSLIATLSLSLTIPMTVLFDVIFKKVEYSRMFIAGSCPMFLSFFALVILTHYDNRDPIIDCIRSVVRRICGRRKNVRLQEIDPEQTESLIGINSSYT